MSVPQPPTPGQYPGPQYPGPQYPGPQYPGQYHPPLYGPGTGPGGFAQKPTSTTGPKITLAVGALVFLAALALGVVAGRTILETIPLDVLRTDGSAGSGVVGTVDAPGSGEVALLGERTYALYLVTDSDRDTALAGTPRVTTLSGATLPTDTSSMSSYVSMGSTRAELVATVDVDAADVYAFEVPDTLDGRGGEIYVTEGDPLSGMLGGIFGGVFGTIAAVALGFVGFVLALVGGIMWGVRRSNAAGQRRA